MEPQIGEIFKQSKELKEIIESYNWTLYDSTTPPKTAFSWEELDTKVDGSKLSAKAPGAGIFVVLIPKR